MAYALLNNRIGDLIWDVQINSVHISQMFPKDTFWYYVLKDWCKLNTVEPMNASEVKNQVLWYNSKICIDGKPIVFWELHNAGVNYVGNLWRNGSFKPIDEIEREYGVKMIMTQYFGLISAIPRDWVNQLKGNINDDNHVSKKLVEKLTGRTVNIAYRMICSQTQPLKNIVEKWRKEHLNINYDLFLGSVRKISSFTICVKLRSFQYKFLMRAILTNVRLIYFKIKDTDKCDFCKDERETVKHLFYECRRVQELWNEVKHITGIDGITYEKIVMNNFHKNPKKVENTIGLVTKFYIYGTKCLGNCISKQGCTNYIRVPGN